MFDVSSANCLGVDPELFFPVGPMAPSTENTLRKICMNCHVFRDCLNYALAVKVEGFWAGTTDSHRKQLRKELGIEAIRLDEQYQESFKAQTPGAITKRASIKRMREAG